MAEVRNLLRDKSELVDPLDQILEVVIHGETDAQKKNLEMKKKKKRVLGGKTVVKKAREKAYGAIQSHRTKLTQR